MKSKEIFSLALRIIGLFFLCHAFLNVPAAINTTYSFPFKVYWQNIIPNLFVVGWPSVIAWWLLRGAPRLMRLAYPEDPRDKQPPLG